MRCCISAGQAVHIVFVPRLCLTSLRVRHHSRRSTTNPSLTAAALKLAALRSIYFYEHALPLEQALFRGRLELVSSPFSWSFFFFLGLRLGWSTPGLQATPTELVAVYNHVAPTMSTVRARASVSLATLSPLESRGRPVAWAPASHDAPVRARKRQAMIVPQWSLASSGSYRYHPDSIHVRRQFSATYSSHLFKPK